MGLPSAKTIKDQWNQFTVENVSSQIYGRPLSTVFSENQDYLFDEENDPSIFHLRYIDYKYLRFCYHPLEDKFFLLSGWKDPLWTNVKVMRAGLDADDRDSREQVFGKNILEIQQKTVPQLLMDEVRSPLAARTFLCMLTGQGFSSVLHIPNCQPYPLVLG